MDDIVSNYNDTVHKTLGKKPNEMTYDDIYTYIKQKLKYNNEIMSKLNLNEDDIVRVLKQKNTLEKGPALRAEGPYKIEEINKYNIKLSDGNSYNPKDIVK